MLKLVHRHLQHLIEMHVLIDRHPDLHERELGARKAEATARLTGAKQRDKQKPEGAGHDTARSVLLQGREERTDKRQDAMPHSRQEETRARGR